MNKEHLQSWAAGFIDGEGCFTIEAKHYRDGRSKDTYYRPRVAVQVRRDDEDSLRCLQKAFGDDGYFYRRLGRKASTFGSASRPTTECAWHTMKGLLAVVAVLDEHQLLGRKRGDYSIWRRAVLVYTDTSIPSVKRQELLGPLRDDLQAIKIYRESEDDNL